MNKIRETIFEAIEKELIEKKLEKAWGEINSIIEKVLEDNGEFGDDLYEIIGTHIDNEHKKNMYIENSKDKKTGKCYYQIEIESQDKEDGYLVDSRYQLMKQNINGIEIDVVHNSMIMKIREMVYMGYVLKQSKEWKEKEF